MNELKDSIIGLTPSRGIHCNKTALRVNRLGRVGGCRGGAAGTLTNFRHLLTVDTKYYKYLFICMYVHICMYSTYIHSDRWVAEPATDGLTQETTNLRTHFSMNTRKVVTCTCSSFKAELQVRLLTLDTD